MTTYNTRNPLGSQDPRDLFDNAQNMDHAANSLTAEEWIDRFGKSRKTWHGIEKKANLDIATAVAEAVEVATAEAETYRDEALDARDDAKAAAGAIGPIKFYSTYADALSDIAGIPVDGLVEISQDETHAGARTRYFKRVGNVLEFAVNLDQLRIELSDQDGSLMIGFNPGFDDTQGFPAVLKLRQSWNIADFLTGSRTDHTQALQKALTHAADEGFAVSVGNNEWNIEDSVLASGGHLTLIGNGPAVSKIIFRESGSGIRQVITSSQHRTKVTGLSLLTSTPLSTGKAALTIDASQTVQSGLVGDRECARAKFSDLFVAGLTHSDSQGWDHHIDLISVGWFDAQRINLRGQLRVNQTDDYRGRGLLIRGDGAPVEMFVRGIWGYNLLHAIQAPDKVEGLMIDKFNLVNVSNGIVVGEYDPDVSLLPAAQKSSLEIVVRDGHINCRRNAVKLMRVNQSSVGDVLVYLNDAGISGITSINGVWLETGAFNSVRGLKVFSNIANTSGSVVGRPLRLIGITNSAVDDLSVDVFSGRGPVSRAIDISNGSKDNNLTDLKVKSAQIGIFHGTDCENNVISFHKFESGVATPFVDSQADNSKKLQFNNSYSRSLIISVPAGVATHTHTLPLPANKFLRRPESVVVMASSTGAANFLSRYDFDNSSRTEINVVFRMPDGSILPSGNYRFSISINE